MLLRADLDIFVHTLLVTNTGCTIGMNTAPVDTTMPYGVLYPQGGPTGEGSWANTEEDRWFNYQVTCVGQDGRQTAWMSDKVRGYLLDTLVPPLAVPGGFIQLVVSVVLGAILPGGENVYQVQDVYRVKAGV